ncbi:hypothetical protein ACFLY6_01375, partial [Candidatus Dependentiae bacterium]
REEEKRLKQSFKCKISKLTAPNVLLGIAGVSALVVNFVAQYKKLLKTFIKDGMSPREAKLKALKKTLKILLPETEVSILAWMAVVAGIIGHFQSENVLNKPLWKPH